MQKHIALGIATLGMLLLSRDGHAASVFGTNLIVNGGAEADTGSPDGSAIGSVTGFSTTGNFTVVLYGASGGFPAPGDPGPADRGRNFFAGGPNIASSRGSQLIDLADGASAIDAGTVTFDLSAFLGGFSSQDDNAALTVQFLDASGSLLGSASIGPVSSVDRNNLTGLLLREATGRVPAGTRSANVELQLTRVAGAYDDGYADDLSLVLSTTEVPPPPPIFETNLVINGDAEADAGSRDGATIGPVTGFVTTGNFTAVTYGASGGFPSPGDPGPADRGTSFFAGGPDEASSSGAQLIDLAAGASSIDLGTVTFELSAFLGGFEGQGDNAVFTVRFLDSNASLLDSTSIGPVTEVDRSNLTGLLLRATSGVVPVGARFAHVELRLSRVAGAYDDGYADNLSLILHAATAASASNSAAAIASDGAVSAEAAAAHGLAALHRR